MIYQRTLKNIIRATGVRQGYRVTRVPADLPALSRELERRFAAREQADLKRGVAVASLLSGEGCLVRGLLAYFGEDLGRNCGHCGRCAGDPAVNLEREEKPFTPPLGELANLRQSHPGALRSPRQAARLLCGLPSPALTKAKLTRHALFGALDTIPFARVLAAMEAAK